MRLHKFYQWVEEKLLIGIFGLILSKEFSELPFLYENPFLAEED